MGTLMTFPILIENLTSYLDHTDNFYETALREFNKQNLTIAQTTLELFPKLKSGVLFVWGEVPASPH